MKRKGNSDVIVAAAIFIILLGAALAAALHLAEYWRDKHNAIQSEAIEAGAGEWRIDSKTGEKSFHWIGSKSDG